MSTKTQTNTQNQYNQGGMAAYNSLIPQWSNQISQFMNNPLGSSFFQNQLGQANQNASQIAQRNTGNVMQNLRAGGGLLGNSGAYVNSLLRQTTQGNSALFSNAFNSTLNNSLNTRNFALQSAQNFQPLQTGQNSTQTKSGLGTWLPQVAGMGLNALMPGLGSIMGGGSFGAGYSNAPNVLAGAQMPNNIGTTPPFVGSQIPYNQPTPYAS